MADKLRLYLIDSASRRRAAITLQFAYLGLHIEPCDSVDEYMDWAKGNGIVFVYDEPGVLDELTQKMAKFGDWPGIICYADAPDPSRTIKAVVSGARNYLTLPFGASDIRAAIASVADRLKHEENFWLRGSKAQSQDQRLTKRDRDVLEDVTDCLSNRPIAKNLAISPHTVELHRANMLSSLGA